METLEKRKRLCVHCYNNQCDTCKLGNSKIYRCGAGTHFMNKNEFEYEMLDDEINDAYETVYGKDEDRKAMKFITPMVNIKAIRREISRVKLNCTYGVSQGDIDLKISMSNGSLQVMRDQLSSYTGFSEFNHCKFKFDGVDVLIDDNLKLGEFKVLRKV